MALLWPSVPLWAHFHIHSFNTIFRAQQKVHNKTTTQTRLTHHPVLCPNHCFPHKSHEFLWSNRFVMAPIRHTVNLRPPICLSHLSLHLYENCNRKPASVWRIMVMLISVRVGPCCPHIDKPVITTMIRNFLIFLWISILFKDYCTTKNNL